MPTPKQQQQNKPSHNHNQTEKPKNQNHTKPWQTQSPINLPVQSYYLPSMPSPCLQAVAQKQNSIIIKPTAATISQHQ